MTQVRRTYSSQHYDEFENHPLAKEWGEIVPLSSITQTVNSPTAWEFDAQKSKAMATFEIYYAEWSLLANSLFPNRNNLVEGYDSDYPRYQTWLKANPAPKPPFCKYCGSNFHTDEHRWCTNTQCDHYLL